MDVLFLGNSTLFCPFFAHFSAKDRHLSCLLSANVFKPVISRADGKVKTRLRQDLDKVKARSSKVRARSVQSQGKVKPS